MWRCPKCNHKFYNTNQSHSCGNFTVEDFLKDKPEKSIELFYHFLSAYETIGKFELHPVKTRIALLTKMRFCSVNRIGKDFIDIHFVLTEAFRNTSCFYRIDILDNRYFVHHLKIRHKRDVNAELKKFMILAYAVGCRAHVNNDN